MAFSFLLLRNFSRRSPKIYYRVLSLISQDFFFSNGGTTKPFSTSDIPQHSDPKPSLSARMSFVFDQIDAIEKERNNKDDALQRIRAWRETKKKKNDEDDKSSKLGVSDSSEVKKKESLFNKEVEVVHPWPEWVELMERLVQQNYFDHRRQDEDKIVKELDIDISSLPEGGVDFTRDWIAVRTACLNFGRDRFDILRSLSRQDIQILVGHGCPSTDKKVVFSGKMLRKHVHLDEGDVCSSCNLRSSCEKAYLLSRKEDEARTIDVMRILLTYGFDPVNSAVENKSLLKLKTVKTVVRKLLHEIVKLSAVPIDPNLPPPIIKKPPPKVKQPPPPPRKRVGRDDIEMKKGDWLCPKCDFMNFAKNNVCLQCDAKRPKRQLLPGEWECPECNFLNYRRNMACFHCDHKRPPDEFMENQMQERQHGPRTRIERITDMHAGSNSWNFDFDDNESDGADVAAFEYADPPRVAEDFPIESQGQGGNVRGFEDDSFENSRISRSSGRGRHSDPDQRKSAVGFDDFDDEEDDDINSYVLETPNNKSMREPSRDFSEVEGYSESDDFDGPSSPSRSVRRKAFSDSDDDEEPSVYSDRKSSHAGDSRNGIRGGGRSGSFKGNMFGSDSEPEIDSGSDSNSHRGIGSNQGKRNKWSSNKKGFRRGGSSDSEDGLAFDSDSDNDDFRSGGKRFGGNKAGPVIRENNFRNDDRRNSYGNAGRGRSSHGSQRSNRESYEGGFGGRRMSERQNSFGNADRGRPSQCSHRNSRESYEDDFGGRRNSYGNANPGRSSRGSFRNDRESNGDGYSGRRGNDRHVSTRNSDRDRQGKGRGFQRNERSNGFNDRSEFTKDLSDDTPRRPRVIERTKPVYE